MGLTFVDLLRFLLDSGSKGVQSDKGRLRYKKGVIQLALNLKEELIGIPI